MTLPAKRRPHLVERAYQAMGGTVPPEPKAAETKGSTKKKEEAKA